MKIAQYLAAGALFISFAACAIATPPSTSIDSTPSLKAVAATSPADGKAGCVLAGRWGWDY